MLNEAIRSWQLAAIAAAAFFGALIVTVVVPEAIRRRWPIVLGLVVAAGAVGIELASEQSS